MQRNLMKKALAVLLLLCLLCPAAQAERQEPLLVNELLNYQGKLTPVKNTRYMLSQEEDGPLWGMVNTSCELMIPHAYGTLSYIAYDCFLGGSYEPLKSTPNKPAEPTLEYINSKALIAADGTLITEPIYGQIKVYSHQWAIGWVLEEATEEDNDYKYDNSHFYKIHHCDVYWLGDYCQPGSAKQDKPYWRGALTRAQYKNAQAHGRYLSIQDRKDRVTMYNQMFRAVGNPDRLNTQAYRVRYYAILNPEGDVVMDGYTEVSEFYTPQGMLLRAARVDYSGVKWNCLYTLDGEPVIEPMDYDFTAVTPDYFVLNKDKKQGLYSRADQRFLVPCEFDKIISHSMGYDDYVMNGYVVVENDGVRSYYDVEKGAVTQAIDSTMEKYNNMSASYSYPEGDQTVLVAADGTTMKTTRSFTAVRGDGYLLPYKEGDYYGLMNWHGKNIMNPVYKNPIVITDDNHVIVNSPRKGYCLYEVE